MGNSISSNPFISHSSKPNYFQNYKFDNFCFEIYDGVEPQVNQIYPTSQYDGIIYQGDDIFMEITIYTIHLTRYEYTSYEIIWLIKSKSDNQLFRPVYKEDKEFCSWLDLIYSWVKKEETKKNIKSTNIQMYPCDNRFTDYYLTRKVYLEQNPSTPHLKMLAGKTHYIEHIGGPEPLCACTCACCGQPRMSKPTLDELINSIETNIDINYSNVNLQFNSNSLKIKLLNGFQISSYVTYYPKNNKIEFSWKHWVHPDVSICYYAKFYKGKFFEKTKGFHRLKYYYPEWVQEDTLWYGLGGIESGSDMFPELSKIDLDENNLFDIKDITPVIL